MHEILAGFDFDKLAIVIPAYKEEYFEKALNSLANQSNKNFILYIGDDNSPFDLRSIVEKFTKVLNIRYTRFNDNIGPKNLVLQWKRCVELTRDEKWIWLFSDDDIADSNCVKNFYETIKIKNDRFDVYRFNITVIDGNEQVKWLPPSGPEEESSEEMAYHLLKGERGNSMPDHIFNRAIYEYFGGFVFTEYAQGADWATSILFSSKKGICIIPESRVYWRHSSSNISSKGKKNRNKMMDGHLQFISWVLEHFEYLKTNSPVISYSQMLEAVSYNFKAVLIYHYKGFGFTYIVKLALFMHSKLGLSYINIIKTLFKIKTDRYLLIEKGRRFKRFVKKAFAFV